MGIGVIFALVVGPVTATLAEATPAAARTGADRPQVRPVKGVRAVRSHINPVKNPAGRNFGPVEAKWPIAKSARLLLGAKPTRATGTPVWASRAAGAAGRLAPAEVAVNVLDQKASARVGANGVLLTVAPGSAAVATGGAVQVKVDYSGFAQAEGADFGARLALSQLPACALTTPEKASCQDRASLKSSNNLREKFVSAPVAVSAPIVLLVAAAAADPDDGGDAGGTFGVTSLAPAGTWSQGNASGSFTYSVPIKVPPGRSDLDPDVSLSYDSSDVDGKTAATQSQSSWVGDGWGTPQSYVEQQFMTCSDSPQGQPSPKKTNDMCYNGPVLTMSLNGASTALVWDAGKNTWRQQSEDGAVVTRVTDSGNGSGTYNTEYWKLTTRDGTVYQFGRNRLPGWATGKAETNSVQSVPVFSPQSGDPCYKSSGFDDSVCTMAYRWNLDYVSDVHGNAMAYYYQQSTNRYGQNMGAKNVSYVRDAYLDRIDYGFTDGGAYGTVPNQVVFATGPRCLTGTCTPLSKDTAKNWPDVPFSVICEGTDDCKQFSPSFFSTVRLTTITTQQWSTATSKYVPVDSYALQQTLPPSGDGGGPTATLWLSQVQRTGQDTSAGGGGSVTLPPIKFGGDQLANRADTSSLPAFYRYRIKSITSETGSVIGVSYTRANPCSTPVTLTPATNATSCYPVSWTPTGYVKPILDWFNKWVVSSVSETDPTGGATPMITQYSYLGGAAWHYDDNESVRPKYRTYGQFRGYAKVETRTGDKTNDAQSLSTETYYQGMSKNNGGATVALTDSQGGTHEDRNQLAGKTLESTTYLGDGGAVDGSTITSYWVSPATATRTRTGLTDLTANLVLPVEEFRRQAVTSGSSTTWRYTQTDSSYDTSLSSPTLGLLKQSYMHTAPTDPSFDSCTSTSYAPANTAKNLVGLESAVETVSVACGGFTAGSPASVPGSANTLTAPASVSRPAQVQSATRTFYDDETFATAFPQASAPTKGDATLSQAARTYASGAYAYQTQGRSIYDAFGRPLRTYDGNGNVTTTSYTDNAVGLMTANSVKNALNQTVSNVLAPARGLIMSSTDVNGVVGAAKYDALGRTTSVWSDSRPTSDPANVKYTYAVSASAPSVVTTDTMNEVGGYATSTALYDALLRVRETQSPTPKSGRLVTEKLYDSRGWVYQENNGWWDSAATPNGTLVTGAISAIPSATTRTFDGLGRAVVSDAQKYGMVAARTTTVYNGDRTTVVPPTGGTVTASITDALGRTIEQRQYTTRPTVAQPSNTFTGIWRVTGGTTTKTSYGYDGHGKQNLVADDAGAAWVTSFDLLGQAVSSSDPDAGTTASVYDANGNVTQSTDSRGQSTSTTYDALDRKTARYAAATAQQASGNKTASWVYDNSDNAVPGMKYPLGELTAKTAYSGGAAYTTQAQNFDVFGNSLGEKVTVPASADVPSGTFSYQHQFTPRTGLKLRDVFPAAGGLPAETVNYGYAGPMDLPDRVGGYANATTYDAFGRIDQVTLGGAPNQAFVTQRYDELTGNLVSKLVTSRVGTAPVKTIDEQVFGYDAAQNVVKQQEIRGGLAATTETQCYRYDEVRRLTGAWTATDDCTATPTSANHSTVGDALGVSSAYWTSWAFNTVGQRTSEVQHATGAGTDTTTTSVYNGAGTSQPHTLTSTTTTGATSGAAQYRYDSTGNMIGRKAAQGDQTLTWNADRKLTQVTAGTTTSTNIYDPGGDLLVQKDPASTTLYLPDQQLTLTKATGVTTGVRYYALPDGTIAYRTGDTTNYGFQISDHHGTPILQLDGTGQTPTFRQFNPFGGPRGAATPSWPDNRTFLQKPTDFTTGLTTVGARQYDPVTGSFISLDPVLDDDKPQSLNGYTYAAANPTTLSDPTGLRIPTPEEEGPGGYCDAACREQVRKRDENNARGHTGVGSGGSGGTSSGRGSSGSSGSSSGSNGNTGRGGGYGNSSVTGGRPVVRHYIPNVPAQASYRPNFIGPVAAGTPRCDPLFPVGSTCTVSYTTTGPAVSAPPETEAPKPGIRTRLSHKLHSAGAAISHYDYGSAAGAVANIAYGSYSIIQGVEIMAVAPACAAFGAGVGGLVCLGYGGAKVGFGTARTLRGIDQLKTWQTQPRCVSECGLKGNGIRFLKSVGPNWSGSWIDRLGGVPL